ncbi:MAG TPA: succinate dehydrogenase [Alphaproteobacteria bacterium]|nr:succinate dehydrogenase [Alphaproteobacteria bacterium]
MAEIKSPALPQGFGVTQRRDAWWLELLPTIVGLGGFGIYATLRAFEGAYFWTAPYLSPFYSPLIDPHHHVWPFSPALLILAGPLGFRVTCYYYRKAYYRAFFLDPPSCAVGEPAGRTYRGETKFPFILQNLHRYFLYLAVLFICFLWYDAINAFRLDGHFFMGVGSLVLLVNVVLLTLYLFSCHSLRHIIGGKVDCFSCTSFNMTRHGAWKKASWLNQRHMLFAWLSLFSVGLADFYVRMVACGWIKDIKLL